jgi:hypothetical protein
MLKLDQPLANVVWQSPLVCRFNPHSSTRLNTTLEHTAILVGKAQMWLPELIERASKLNVNGGFEQGADVSVHFYLFPPAVKLIDSFQWTAYFACCEVESEKTDRFS